MTKVNSRSVPVMVASRARAAGMTPVLFQRSDPLSPLAQMALGFRQYRLAADYDPLPPSKPQPHPMNRFVGCCRRRCWPSNSSISAITNRLARSSNWAIQANRAGAGGSCPDAWCSW